MAKLSAKSVRSTEVGGIFLAKSLIYVELYINNLFMSFRIC